MEGLVRATRNQFLAALLVSIILWSGSLGLLGVNYEGPWGAQDFTQGFAERLTLFLGLTVFVAFLFELLLGSLGSWFAEVVCESLRTASAKNRILEENAALAIILSNEPLLDATVRGKRSFVQFYAVARHLSQERFKDFPELSPLREFESAKLYSIYFPAFLVALAWFAVARFIGRSSDLMGWVPILIAGIVTLLLFVNAQARYLAGRDSTLISLREKLAEAGQRRLEDQARSISLQEADRTRKEAENFRAESLNKLTETLLTVRKDIESPQHSERNVGLTTFESVHWKYHNELQTLGPALDLFLEIVLLSERFYDDGDDEYAGRLLRVGQIVLKKVTSLDAHSRIEECLTPIVLNVLKRADIGRQIVSDAARIAGDLRSRELVTVLLDRLRGGREDSSDPDIAIGRFGLEQVFGNGSVLAVVNRDLVLEELRRRPEFGQDPRLKSRCIAEGLQKRCCGDRQYARR